MPEKISQMPIKAVPTVYDLVPILDEAAVGPDMNKTIRLGALAALYISLQSGAPAPQTGNTAIGGDYRLSDGLGLTLTNLLSNIGGAPATIRLVSGTYTLSADLTIPANITMKPEWPARLVIPSGITLTINGGFEAGPYQCFSCTGSGAVAGLTISRPEWFGAAGDDATDDSTAITNAYNAVAPGGILLFWPGKTYIWDTELFITKPMIMDGNGARIKLKDNSALFNNYISPWGRYLIHVRSSDVEIKGFISDGNSPNNYKIVGGVTYYNYITGGLWGVSGIIMVGFYGSFVTPSDLNNINIHDNKFIDSPGAGIDSLNQGHLHLIYGLEVERNYFEHGQGVQVSLSDTVGAVVHRNRFHNPYDFTVQTYYNNYGANIGGNITYFKSSEINLSEVDWINKDATGTKMLWAGQMRLGKLLMLPSYGTLAMGNTFFGACIQVTAGTIGARIAENNIYESEDAGIIYIDAYTTYGDNTTQWNITNPSGNIFRYTYAGVGTDPGIFLATVLPLGTAYLYGGTIADNNRGYQNVTAVGTDYFEVYNPNGIIESGKTTTLRWSGDQDNVIENNTIRGCQFTGLYLDGSLSVLDVINNKVTKNHASSADYGGRTILANIAIASGRINLRENFARAYGVTPYGLHIMTGAPVQDYVAGSLVNMLNIYGNDMLRGGITSDFYDPDGGQPPNVPLLTANVPPTDYSSLSTVVGWAPTPTVSIEYSVLNKKVFIKFDIDGSSNVNTASFTAPFINNGPDLFMGGINVADNGNALAEGGALSMVSGSNVVILYKDGTNNATGWTATNGKIARGQFSFDMP